VRARARRRVERIVSDLIDGVTHVRVVWARGPLPDKSYAVAIPWTAEFWILFPDDVEPDDDTIAHEVAHVLAWVAHGQSIQPHGREWRAWYRRCKKSLDA
jgi:hypothetical protein